MRYQVQELSEKGPLQRGEGAACFLVFCPHPGLDDLFDQDTAAGLDNL